MLKVISKVLFYVSEIQLLYGFMVNWLIIIGRLVIGWFMLVLKNWLFSVVNSSGVVLFEICVMVSSMLVIMFVLMVCRCMMMVIFQCGVFSVKVVLCRLFGISFSMLLVVCIIIGMVISEMVKVLVQFEKWFMLVMQMVQMNRLIMIDGVDSMMLVMKWVIWVSLFFLLYLVRQMLVRMLIGVLMRVLILIISSELMMGFSRLLLVLFGLGVFLVSRFRFSVVMFLKIRVSRIQVSMNRFRFMVRKENSMFM